MNCWSCQKEVKDIWKCPSCGSLQVRRPGMGHFEVLGLERTYFLDEGEVEKNYKELLKSFHPDRFARKGTQERRYALDWTTALNDAYRILKDPPRRGQYILELQGLQVGKEGGQSKSWEEPEAEFLEEILEQRQLLWEAKLAKDLAQVIHLGGLMKEKIKEKQVELAGLFQEWEITKEISMLHQAAKLFIELKYNYRYVEEAESYEQEALQE